MDLPLESATDEHTRTPQIKPVTRSMDFPATLGQMSIWYVRHKEGVDHSYNEQYLLRIRGRLSVSRLEYCFNRLIERHESLRTVFILNAEGDLIQRIVKPFKIKAETATINVDKHDKESISREIKNISLTQGKRPYNLEKGPLLRLCLVQLPTDEQELIVSAHHSAMDGTSGYILLHEWQEIDKVYQQPDRRGLPSLPLQPADYAVYEKEYLNSPAANTAKAYWRKKLSDFPPLLNLPYDKPWHPNTPPLGAWEPIHLGKDLVETLRSTGRSQGVSINITLIAAFQALLMRYTNQTDIVIGSPRANRNTKEIRQTIGHFANTVILRNTLTGEKRFCDLLKEVKSANAEASNKYNLPYLSLNEIARERGKPANQPLYQAGIEYRNFKFKPFQVENCLVADLRFQSMGDAKFDILFSFTDTDNGLSGHVEFNTELFARITVVKLFKHYKQLLHSIVENPFSSVSSLNILLSEEKKALYDWNQTEKSYPVDVFTHQLFEEYVAKTPQAVAVTFQDQHISYDELDRRSNALAGHLRTYNIEPGAHIGLSASRSIELPLGVLGILKAGGAYVPLDPHYPQERLDYMAKTAGVGIILTNKSISLPVFADKTIVMLGNESSWTPSSRPFQHSPVSASKLQQLAYIIFTSGSTGRPKAVSMSHKALANLVRWQVEQSTSTAGTRTLQFSPISFDVSFQEMFSTWNSGGTLVLIDETVRQDTVQLCRFIDSERINRLFMPFIALQQLAEVYKDIAIQASQRRTTDELRPGHTLKEIITAGEQLQITPPIRGLFEQLPACKLHNHYGPSETHVCTALRLDDNIRNWDSLPPIGRPIANSKAYILDQTLQPVPIGLEGELYIGGLGLARGYLNRSDLTAERFIANPFTDPLLPASTKNRIYKTGDLARFREDGTIEFKGRADNQIKIRGFRIEPGEIEQTLTEQECVKEAIVNIATRQGSANEKYLAAYVIAEDKFLQDEKLSLQTRLREKLQDVLPDYMIPTVFLFLNAFPITPSGKVDRKALPQPYKDLLPEKTTVKPNTATEQSLLEIWAEVLGLSSDQIGIEDTFLELGGHSLLATRVTTSIRKKFGAELSIRDLFIAEDIQGLALKIVSSISDKSNIKAISNPLRPLKNREKLSLSFAQQRIWFLSQFENRHETLYNIPWILRLSGPLNAGALQQAFNALLQRHEILRTVFHSSNDGIYQSPLEKLPFLIPIIDIQGNDLTTEIEAYNHHIFSLPRGPLLNVKLLRCSVNMHMLMMSMHHIISDGWSIGIVNRELSQLYSAYCADSPVSLPALPIQYADFAHWQQQWLQGSVLEQQLTYWKSQLKGAPALLTLPSDRSRPAMQSFRGQCTTFTIPPDITKQLHSLSRKENTTLFMTLLAGFNLLLARYSGQSDICIGSPIANRQRLELENLVGLFVNTLVLRTKIDLQNTVKALLAQVRETALGAYAHQDVPFEYLVEKLQPERSLSYSPLFQVMFALQNTENDFNLPDIQVSKVEDSHANAKFDISMGLEETHSSIEGVVEYNTDLFNHETIDRFVEHYKNILFAFVSEPETNLADIDLLSGEERSTILKTWNLTETQLAEDLCIHQLFEQKAKRHPDAVAALQQNDILTYDTLNRRSNQLANFLLAKGIAPETRVGIYIDRSLDMLTSILAVIKIGCAYVPMDPRYPQQRVNFIIADAAINIVLTNSSLNASVEEIEHPPTIICIDTQQAAISRHCDANINRHVPVHSLAYIIYTSGSTGKPKGVMISHHSINNTLHFLQEKFTVTENDAYLLKTNYVFDVSLSELFAWFIGRGRLVILPPGAEKYSDELANYIIDHRITHLNFVPSMLSLFLEQMRSNKALREGSSIKHLMVAGEIFSKSLLKESLDLFGGVGISNIYGPTESSIYSSWHTCSDHDTQSNSIPIGRPIWNTQLYIVDQYLNPVPIGVAGELCIASRGLAWGYNHLPDLSATSFIPNPFGSTPGSRLYKTGDMVRYLGDGSIDYIGRKDFQIKIRGYRIELGEIENSLQEQIEIQDCVVLAHYFPRDNEDWFLVAYVVVRQGAGIEESILRNALQSRLPEYMVPRFISFIDEIPLTVNGKVDRKALPLPDQYASNTGEYVAPTTDIERSIAAVWAALLRLPVDNISVHDNFFDLGGHSLLATRVIGQLRTDLNAELQVRDLFSQNTIRKLAVKIESLRRKSPMKNDSNFALVAIDRNKDLSLSFAQQRLWFLNTLEGENDILYNIPGALHLVGELNVIALNRAFNTLGQRHETLKTIFRWRNNSVTQVIDDSIKIRVDIIDSKEDDVPRMIEANARYVFDLGKGPLLTAKIIRLSPRNHYLLLNIHHIISDGWSIGILNRELSLLYKNYRLNKPSPLTALPVQYVDFAHWQRQWLRGKTLELQLAYWEKQLRGAPALLEFPTDRPRPATQCYEGRSTSFTIATATVEKLKQLSSQENATFFMIMLTGFNLLLARYSSQEDICIGTPIANRQRPELEGLIGFFVNTLVMRTRINANSTIRDLLTQVKETALAAYAHQDIPFEYLVEKLQPERSLSYSPLFQVMFVLQNIDLEEIALPGVEVSSIKNKVYTSKFDFSLFIWDSPDKLEVTVEYNTRLFDYSTIERLISHYERLLEDMTNNLDQPVQSAILLDDSEYQEIIYDWNKTETSYPSTPYVHQVFERQVSETPEVIAVVHRDHHISYRELNCRSNQLARHLRKKNPGNSHQVGLAVNRSLDLAVGILAILKAGFTYVPLDPSYPRQRLDYMLEEANISILLAQKALLKGFPERGSTVVIENPHIFSAANEAADIKTCGKPKDGSLAYVIFTSGSTGRPKAVAMPHTALTNLIHWQISQSGSTTGKKTLQFSPFSFDVSFQELFSTWCSGGTLMLISEELRKDAFSLWEFIQQEKVNRLFTPFIALQQLAEVYEEKALQSGLDFESQKQKLGHTLEEIITAGEQLQITRSIRTLFRRLPGCQLYNHYGPSETHVCTALRLQGASNNWETLPTIGKPISNCKIYILDEAMQPVPIGVYGEIYVGGVGLATGYLNRQGLTNERFIANPFIGSTLSNHQKNRLYKTGDLARFRSNGEIEYMGRKDSQVKIRGFRVELGEIEQVLVELQGVKEAVVNVYTQSGNSNQYLAAYLVIDSAFSKEKEDSLQYHLSQDLQDLLPEYMLPSRFILLDSLPLTPSGKVDRKALPTPEDNFLIGQTHVSPAGQMENGLAGIWAGILDIPKENLSSTSSFFDLGGHSLLATRLVSQIRKTYDVELQVRDLFINSTIKKLAAKIENLILEQPLANTKVFPLQPIRDKNSLPLSFAQQRLWFLNQFEENTGTLYNISWAQRLSGNLNVNALQQAFKTIVRRHDSLRTSFEDRDGITVQVISNDMIFHFPIIDSADQQVFDDVKQHLRRRFDLNKGPLFNVALLRLSSQEHILAIGIHHIIFDGWSIGILNQELGKLYKAYHLQEPVSLSPLPIQYADFSYWQRQWLQGEILEKHVNYWQSQLAGIPGLLELATDMPRPAIQRYRGNCVSFKISSDMTQRLHQLSRRENITLFMALIAGFKMLLARYSGQNDICIGTPIANRQRADLEGLIGLFVNTLVLRTQIDPKASVKSLLTQVRETALKAYSHQDIPFEYLVDTLKPERSLSYSPLFQCMFILQNAQGNALALPDATIERLDINGATAKFDITMSLEETNGEIAGIVEYNTDIFHAATIRQLVNHYSNILKFIVKDTNRVIHSATLLDEKELREILIDWNRTEVEYPKQKCVHQLIEEQAAIKPHAIAVVFRDKQITYDELNGRGNQLASHLLSLGISPETRIGLCIERSMEMVVGLIGILKSGGCYIPIDPEYPAQRIRYIVANSQVDLILSHSSLDDAFYDHNSLTRLNLDSDWHKVDTASRASTKMQVDSRNLAYIIYTSGSTGNPKGVMIPHRALTNFLLSMKERPGINSQDSLLAVTTYCFDIAALEIYLPLIAGGLLCVCDNETVKDPEKLIENIDNYKTTVMQATPATWKMLFQSGWVNSTKVKILCGGEALSANLRQSFLKTASEAWNLFGPTETTIWSTLSPILEQQPITIGRPIANTQVYVIDSHEKPVPIGVPGELCIGGDGLSRGYLNQPGLTAEKFVENPFLANTKIYKTGDLARWLPNGELLYIGRIDHQVKVRGYRIELGEIEEKLNQIADIKESVAIVQTRAAGEDNYISAYLVIHEESNITQDQIKLRLKEFLPEYMIPSKMAFLDALPLTPNGKIDRKSLPEIDSREPAANSDELPKTEIEKVMAEIWSSVLEIPLQSIGIYSSFFSLGGDSLLSLQVIYQARKRDIPINAKDIFENQTLDQLGKHIAQKQQRSLQAKGIRSIDMTPAQKWHVSLHADKQRNLIQSFLLSVPAGFNPDFLLQFLDSIFQQHDALRFRFYPNEELWSAEHVPYHSELKENVYSQIDVSHFDSSGIENEIAKVFRTALSNLKVESYPLLKVVYFKARNSMESRLLWMMHSFITDGNSWYVLFDELSKSFHQWQLNGRISSGISAYSFGKFCEAVKKSGETSPPCSGMAYWLRQEDHKSLKTSIEPAKYGADAFKRSEVAPIVLDRKSTERLIKECNLSYNTQTQELLLSHLVSQLAKSFDYREVSLIIEDHDRKFPNDEFAIAQAIGCFSTVYPLHISLEEVDNRKDYQATIDLIKDKLRRIPNGGIDYGLLKYGQRVSDLRSSRDDFSDLIMFNYMGQLTEGENSEYAFKPIKEYTNQGLNPQTEHAFLISIKGFIVNNNLNLSIDFNPQKISRECIEVLRNGLATSLDCMISHCSEHREPITKTYSSVKDIPYQWSIGVFRERVFRNFEPLVRYSSSNSDTKLFMLPPGVAGLESYIGLVDSMPPGRSICLLENIEMVTGKLFSIPSLATYYLNMIKRVQRSGPYFIGGWSRGAILSHVVAKKLMEEGQEVKALFLLDPLGYTLSEEISDAVLADPRVAELDDAEFANLEAMLHSYKYTRDLADNGYTGAVVHFKSSEDHFFLEPDSPRMSFYKERLGDLNMRVIEIFRDYYSFHSNTKTAGKARGGLEFVFPNCKAIYLEGNHYDVLEENNRKLIAATIDSITWPTTLES